MTELAEPASAEEPVEGMEAPTSILWSGVVRFRVLFGKHELRKTGTGASPTAAAAADAAPPNGGQGSGKDAHTMEEEELLPKLNDRPYLLLVTAQRVELFAVRRAEFSRDAADADLDCSALSVALGINQLPPFAQKAIRLMPIRRAVKRGVTQAGKLAAKVAQGWAGSDAAVLPGIEQVAGEELEPGAVVALVVAFSQLVSARQTGANLIVTFRRQKPRVRLSERAGKLVMPWADSDQDPMQRICMLGLPNEAAAAELLGVIQAARQRLAAAVQWASRGLPLFGSPAPALVTIQPAPPAAGGGSAPAVGAEVLAAAPLWGSPIPLPQHWARQAADGGTATGSGPSFSVVLSTPLGPAAASISMRQLAAAYEDGRQRVTVEAQPLLSRGFSTAPGSTAQLRVLVQASMQRGDTGQAPHGDPPASPADWAMPAQLLAIGAGAAAVAAAWLQLLVSSGPAAQPASPMQWAAFGACNAAALLLVLLVLLAVKRRPGGAGGADGQQGWLLTLLQAALVSGSGTLLQHVEVEAGVAGEEAEKGSEKGADAQLPESFRKLIVKHSDVVDANMAGRFIATYPSPSKAYTALVQVVEWRRQQGLVGLLDQPHPQFERIKRCYPHAVLGWSAKKDCLVTLDSYGVWKQSYEQLKAEGVTEDEMLRHLMLCMDFNFAVLDTRPWPLGKSVNIVNLSGLRMSDAAGEAFRFISKAGALLSLHYPGRLHRAFLINAPSWWSIVWRLVSPLIDAKTRELMHVYSIKDKAGARDALLEWIDADVLPQDFGGDSTAELYTCSLEQQLWAHVRSNTKGSLAAPSAAGSSEAADSSTGSNAAAGSAPSTP